MAAVFDDEVRAEQSAAAIQVWARAHRELGVGPVAVLARDASGGTTYRPQHVTSPRWGALTGLLVGLILLGLPAAGAAGLAVWALGSVIFGVFGLIGVIPSAEVGSVTVAATAVGSALAALLVGAVGGLLGALVGLLWGLLVHHLRGFGRSDVARALAMLQPGSAATIVRVATPSSPLVDRELARLGGVTAVGSGTPV